MHKCDTCKYKGEHQEMGFKPSGVCTKEHDLIKAVLAYRAKKCPFAKKVELEPCPFCGKQPRIFRGFMPSEDGTVYQLLCINPDCKNPSMTSFNPTKQMAIDEWNESMTDLEEKLVELLKEIGMLEIEDILYTAEYLIAHGVTVKEPQKPLTVDELYSLCGSGCHCIYVEHRNFAIGDDSNAITPNIGNRSRTGYRIIHYNGYQYNFCWCDYGKHWRCWAEKPTEEERKAAEWEN